MRIVVYAEGSRDLGSSATSRSATGDAIDDASLGVAHLIVRRTIEPIARIVRFDTPLAYERRRAIGSELLQPRVLKRLLQWPMADLRPDLAIVLVDRDGDPARERALRDAVASARHAATPPVVIAVAVEEIEAWLLSDTAALANVLSDGNAPSTPDKMPPGAAKTELEARINRRAEDVARRWQLRVELAHALDLDRVAAASRSFESFRKELVSAARDIESA